MISRRAVELIEIAYRELEPEEADFFATIERAETIRESYVMRDGRLELVPVEIDVTGWHPSEVSEYIARIRETLESNGAVFAAWNGDTLVGIGTLVTQPIGGDSSFMKLDLLHVSAGYRGRGVGKRLVHLVTERARELGASRLYISATPTRGTVDAYLQMGASVLAIPDPDLLAEEPEDIHLVLDLIRQEGAGSDRD